MEVSPNKLLLDESLSAGLKCGPRSEADDSPASYPSSPTSLIFPRVVIERKNHGNERIHYCMSDVSRLLNRVKKHRESWEFLYTMIHLTNANFIKKGTRMVVEADGVEGSRLAVVFHKCIGGLNDEKDAFLSSNLKAGVIKMSNAQHFHHRRIHGKALE